MQRNVRTYKTRFDLYVTGSWTIELQPGQSGTAVIIFDVPVGRQSVSIRMLDRFKGERSDAPVS